MTRVAGNKQPQSKRRTAPPRKELASVVVEIVPRREIVERCAVALACLAIGLWAYWPTLNEIVAAWDREPDYSHGYLVVPMSAYFLWSRRKSFPGIRRSSLILGFGLIAFAFSLRLFAGAYYFDAIDGWSILPWIGGLVAILFGAKTLRWALPALGFLVFMIPLPYRLEGTLSLPLQRIATKLSCWLLQLLGQPAVAEGNTILIGPYTMEIAEACSGLRLFVSITALAVAYLILSRNQWWEKMLLVLSIPLIAIVANSLRIVSTSLLYQWVSSEAGKKFSHDFAGWVMIPLAAAMFWLVLWYLGKLFREQEQLTAGALVQQAEI